MLEYIMEEYVAYGLMYVLLAFWRALPLFAVVFGIHLVFRKRIAARFHCLLWAVVLVRMLCPVSLESPVSIHGTMDRLADYVLTEPQDTVASSPPYEVFTYLDDDGKPHTIAQFAAHATPEERAAAADEVAAINAAPDVDDYATASVMNPAGIDWELVDRKSTRLNSSHTTVSRMPSSA